MLPADTFPTHFKISVFCFLVYYTNTHEPSWISGTKDLDFDIPDDHDNHINDDDHHHDYHIDYDHNQAYHIDDDEFHFDNDDDQWLWGGIASTCPHYALCPPNEDTVCSMHNTIFICNE